MSNPAPARYPFASSRELAVLQIEVSREAAKGAKNRTRSKTKGPHLCSFSFLAARDEIAGFIIEDFSRSSGIGRHGFP